MTTRGDDWGERLATLENQMKTALEGVGNFRQFQTDARKFFNESKARDDERKEILLEQEHKIRDGLAAKEAKDAKRNRKLTLLITFVALLVSAFGVWILFREYEQKAKINPPPAPISRLQLPQDAGSSYRF